MPPIPPRVLSVQLLTTHYKMYMICGLCSSHMHAYSSTSFRFQVLASGWSLNIAPQSDDGSGDDMAAGVSLTVLP